MGAIDVPIDDSHSDLTALVSWALGMQLTIEALYAPCVPIGLGFRILSENPPTGFAGAVSDSCRRLARLKL
jgi:hypothetical protein